MMKQEKIQIEFDVDESKYDEYNQLILSGKSNTIKKVPCLFSFNQVIFLN